MHSPPIIASGVFLSENWGLITGCALAISGGIAGWMLHAWRSPRLPDSENLDLPRELSHQEAQFRFIFESVPVGISLKLRERGKNLLWHINDEHLRIAGMTRKEVLDGTAEDRFTEITHPYDLARQQAFYDRLEAGKIDRFDLEKRYILRDGRTVWVAFTGLRRDLPDGVEIHLNTAVDITAQKELASQLATAKAEAESANHTKSRFLANMSHEIRTPMSGMLGMAELLLDSNLDKPQRELAETIRSCGERLIQIINDILDISRVEAGKLEIQNAPFLIEPMLSKAVELFAYSARKKGINLECRVDPQIPAKLAGDELRLSQILINLVGNAVKFTAKGSVVVEVSSADGAPGKTVLCFRVTDTGIGMREDALRRVFDPFTQADESTTREYGGTGLGLSISKNLVELMEGSIGAESREREGSLFWFTVPLDNPGEGTSEYPGGRLPASCQPAFGPDLSTGRSGSLPMCVQETAKSWPDRPGQTA